MLVLLLLAAMPLPTYPECGTPERTDLCPSDLGTDWQLLSWIPEAWEGDVREGETAPGVRADLAWRTTTGSPEVVVAVLDSGILWDEIGLRRKHFLNAAELPIPEGAEAHDANGDGVFNVDDYLEDTRVDPNAHPGGAADLIDPGDLILTFSDGVDDDGNGYTDDISGWDFFWDDNDPYDDTVFDHGTYEASEALREGGDGEGGIGVCPNCMVLNVRVGDSFVADGANFASGLVFSVDSGAAVASEALGTLTHPASAGAAIDYAWEHDVLLIASAADETAWHQNSPGWNARTLYVHAVVPNEGDADESESFFAYSNCTNHGPRLELSASSGGCSSGATAITAGVAGLVLSAGVPLSAGELKQVLLATAEDISVPESLEAGSRYYPSKPGWDRYFGYGRVDASAAVDAVVGGHIPPAVEITGPGWFTTVSGPLTITGEADAAWVLELGQGDEPESWVELGSGPAGDVAVEWTPELEDLAIPEWSDQDPVAREDVVNAHTVTLRLRAVDEEGDEGVDRRALYVVRDPDQVLVLDLGASLESSPKLVDLDGDGAAEILQADADGRLHVFDGWGQEKPGFPVRLGPAEEMRHGLPVEVTEGVIGTPAVGDLDGDGSLEIVLGGIRGSLIVFGADGQVRPGFPVIQEEVVSTDADHLWDEGFFSSPALGDLDGDGGLDIVVGGMDQKVYAFDADGSLLPGFPAFIQFPGYEGEGSRIVSSPALGDIDGDGRLEIAIGTNETVGSVNGGIYVLEDDGSVKPGWPVRVNGAFTQALPYVGEGVPVSPALADVDGDGLPEIAAWTQAGDFLIFDGDGSALVKPDRTLDTYGAGSNVPDGGIFPLITNPSFGDLDNDGSPELIGGAMGADYAIGLTFDGKRWPFSHAIGAWSANGDFLPGWPRKLEDMQFFTNPAVADVDGDERPEVITGTAGYLVHAFSADGREPAGWPKLTGQWNMSSPAVGDIDGDGMLEVVQSTRGGLLYVWSTPTRSDGRVDWAGFGHDAANTRNYENALAGFNVPLPGGGGYAGGCAGCASPGGVGAVGLLAIALLRRRR